jgi:ribonuclease III
MDQGLEVVEGWLNPLFRPYTTAAYQIIRNQHGLPPLPTPTSPDASPPSSSSAPAPDQHESPSDFIPLTSTIGHLALFNQHLQKANRVVEWVYSDDASEGKNLKTTPIWAVDVLVDGELFGQGSGYTKKAARNEAAKVGLKNLGIFVW